MKLSLPALLIALLLVSSTALGGKREYQVLRWNEDWTWLETEMPADSDAFDPVKHVRLGGDWRFSLGGSFRLRLEADGHRTLGASAAEDEERALFRGFLHWEFAHSRVFRWFAELGYSDAWGEDRPVGAVFRDDLDLQNFFFEFRAGASGSHPVTFRLGRQEMLFGAQRLVSPLNWSSARRTFDGISVTFDTPRTRSVLFATHPVRNEVHDFDSPDSDFLFAGLHASFRPAEGHLLEGLLVLQDDRRDGFLDETGTRSGDLARRTYGLRYLFREGGWKLDLEAALQDGHLATDSLSAGMFSATGSRTWVQAPWRPTLEAGLDLATGDTEHGDGRRGTFHQLYPLGHAYLGHLDLVGRQNVEALRVGLSLQPAQGWKWVTTLHRFRLAEARDALYNAGGAVVRSDPTGASGDDVATELDVLLSYSFATHHSVAIEVAKWWSDGFIEKTGDGDDAWFAWLAYEFKF